MKLIFWIVSGIVLAALASPFVFALMDVARIVKNLPAGAL